MSDAEAQLDLRCPECGYSVIGLPAPRCPECGSTYDPLHVARIARGQPTHATPWDTDPGPASFLRTFAWSLASPGGLARRFPPVHDAPMATRFSLLCYAFAAAILLLGAAIGDADDARFGIVLSGGIILGGASAAWACETVVAAVVALLAAPEHVSRRYHYWRGLTHYLSSYTVVSAAAGGFGLLGIGSRFTAGEGWIALTVAGLIVAALWWALGLGGVIVSRGAPGVGRWFAALAPIVVGVAAVYLGAYVAAVTIGAVYVLVRSFFG